MQEAAIASRNMVSAARTILMKNPNVRKVLILDRTPRFDTKSADPLHLKSKLSDYANRILREEREKIDVKAQVVIAPHSLPGQFQENLYGHPDSHLFDGIHLLGKDGRNHYTRSVCNILQNFLSDHTRELHNHNIPRIQQASPTLSRSKPDHVVINIESENPPADVITCSGSYSYTIPTSNSFSVLGN